jgi:hypothetical protein
LISAKSTAEKPRPSSGAFSYLDRGELTRSCACAWAAENIQANAVLPKRHGLARTVLDRFSRSFTISSRSCRKPSAPCCVVLLADDREGTAGSVERLMGTEARFALISDQAELASDNLLDV